MRVDPLGCLFAKYHIGRQFESKPDWQLLSVSDLDEFQGDYTP